MFNFKDIVSNILLEQEPANTDILQEIQNLYKDNSTFKELTDIYCDTYEVQKEQTLQLVAKYTPVVTAQKGYFAGKTLDSIGGYSFIPFYDAFTQILEKNPNPKVDFIVELKKGGHESIFQGVTNRIKQTTAVEDYQPVGKLLLKAKQVLDNQTDKLSQTAIETLNSNSIGEALSKIVAKRISVLDRITSLKGPKAPFNKTVLQPVLFYFKKYAQVQGWSKKISGDFSKLVDDISANNLINVAIAAKDYYIHILRTKLQGGDKLTSVNAGLNLFDKFTNSLLQEAPLQTQYQVAAQRAGQQTNNSQSQQTTQTGSQLTEDIIKNIDTKIGLQQDTDYTNFINSGQTQYIPGTTFNIGTISKDPSKEAKALYNALKNMAYYVRTSVGAKDRLKYVGQAGSALAGFGGATLYGGQ